MTALEISGLPLDDFFFLQVKADFADFVREEVARQRQALKEQHELLALIHANQVELWRRIDDVVNVLLLHIRNHRQSKGAHSSQSPTAEAKMSRSTSSLASRAENVECLKGWHADWEAEQYELKTKAHLIMMHITTHPALKDTGPEPQQNPPDEEGGAEDLTLQTSPKDKGKMTLRQKLGRHKTNTSEHSSHSLHDVRCQIGKFVDGTFFNVTSGLIIFLFLIFVVIKSQIELTAALNDLSETEVEAAQKDSTWESVKLGCQTFFLFAFTAELVLKIIGKGFRYVFCGPDRGFNIFDGTLILIGWQTSITENVLRMEASFGDVSFLRMLRLLKLTKVLRVMHFVSWTEELRNLLDCITLAGPTLVWSIVLTFVASYIASLAFMMGLTGYLKVEEDVTQLDDYESIKIHFGSLLNSLNTLFASLSAGVEWEEPAHLLTKAGSHYYCLFIMYMAFVVLTVLNVVQGLFIDSALKVVEGDSHHLTEAALAEERNHDLFDEALALIDDGSGYCVHDTFDVINKVDGAMMDFLEAFSIDAFDASSFYKTLDRETNGCVECIDFLSGCMQLKGVAKSTDMAFMSVVQRKWAIQLAFLVEYIHDMFEHADLVFQNRTSVAPNLLERLDKEYVLPSLLKQSLADSQGLDFVPEPEEETPELKDLGSVAVLEASKSNLEVEPSDSETHLV